MKMFTRYKRFEVLYQVVSWAGTVGLILVVVFSPTTVPALKPFLLLLASLFGIASLLFANLLPMRSRGVVKYEPEDKVLIESLVIILLLTGFLYLLPLTSSGFFLLLIPILIEATVLHERIILAEAGFSFVSIVFLRIANIGSRPLFDGDFVIEMGIFFAVIMLMYYLTRQLRKSGEENDELSKRLSARLDQIQVISMLVQESENFARFEYLLERIGEITSNAFDAEQCGFFLPNDDGELFLHESSVGFGKSDREVYKLTSNMKTILEVFVHSRLLVVNNEEDAEKEGVMNLIGDRHLRNFMMVPLTIKDKNVGVLLVANKRGGSFDEDDPYFLQLLAGFISTLIDSANAFLRVEEERISAKKMTKLLVGRELMMREMKKRLKKRGYET